MSKIKAVPFKKEHIGLIDIRDLEKETLEYFGASEQRLAYLEATHCAETILYKGIVLGVVGFIEITSKVFELFLFPSKYLYENRIAFARLMRYYKEEAITHYNWHRLQIITPDDELHKRWASFLGFEKEGVLRKYDYKGRDQIMWSVVR